MDNITRLIWRDATGNRHAYFTTNSRPISAIVSRVAAESYSLPATDPRGGVGERVLSAMCAAVAVAIGAATMLLAASIIAGRGLI